MDGKSLIVSSLLLGACFIAGMYTLAPTLEMTAKHLIESERLVTVKGLAERRIKADHVYIPIGYSVKSYSHSDGLQMIDAYRAQVLEHIKRYGIRDNDIGFSMPSMYTFSEGSNGTGRQVYSISAGVYVSTDNMEAAEKLKNSFYELMNAGIPLTDQSWDIRYTYNGLNDIKPAMVEEATRNAREVAEKFARDSGSSLGKIKTANQGVFSINGDDKDPNKLVRVVSTVQFYLND